MPINTDHRPVRSTSPVAPYLGGKRNLAATIIKRIASIPHHLYAEPFVGMGGVFLRRPTAAPVEVINDYGRDVANLFRILQRHYVPFLEMMKFQLTCRAEFERLVATDPLTLTDMERAARFLYLQRTCFGGKISGRNFGVSSNRPARFDITRLAPLLEEVHSRLAGVVIECLPYGSFLERYDRPDALFYLDPPYWNCESDYGKGMFCRADFEVLAAQLAKLKGKFILSLNDVPEVRQIFQGFRVEAVETTYSVSKGKGKRVGEVLITCGGS
ncbi:DNA adenine methylase [Telmatospirillum sp. J64-1]|uniref:DNA adenine methylase n=1 Tax=Telmatospirillum sp. J64-1 TaxID=2502183 RepID=UPI00115EA35D|nr:DNA adenine methylase [Telmatospirillum sp. J64-1]